MVGAPYPNNIRDGAPHHLRWCALDDDQVVIFVGPFTAYTYSADFCLPTVLRLNWRENKLDTLGNVGHPKASEILPPFHNIYVISDGGSII